MYSAAQQHEVTAVPGSGRGAGAAGALGLGGSSGWDVRASPGPGSTEATERTVLRHKRKSELGLDSS